MNSAWVLDVLMVQCQLPLTMLFLLFNHSIVSDSFRPHGLQPAGLICPWDFPSNNTGVGCHFFLQGIFWTQRSNLCLLNWQEDSLRLSHQGSPPLPIETANMAIDKAGKSKVFPLMCEQGNDPESVLKLAFLLLNYLSL